MQHTEVPKERVVAFMQREHVRTQSRPGGQRQRIVGSVVLTEMAWSVVSTT
jgi:hypothetical protein